MLNYKYLNIKQRSNSFIENYNKQLHNIINNHIKLEQYTTISWPLFISLIINEENRNKNIIIENLVKNHKTSDIFFVKTKVVGKEKKSSPKLIMIIIILIIDITIIFLNFL